MSPTGRPALALALVLLVAPAMAVTVTINDAVRYQTFEGFGGFGPLQQWWLSGPYYNDAHLNRIVDTLGATILREQLYYDFEPANDNTDPNVANSSGFNLNGFLARQLPFWRAIKAKADASGQPLNIIWSIWSPPAWMKTNNSVTGGGSLRTDMYEEFAEYCAEYVKMVKRQTGIDVYALSLQNEPRFAQSYESCVYTPQQLTQVMNVVSRRFDREGLTTEFSPAEDMLAQFSAYPFIGTVMQDTLVRRHTRAWAFHGYTDGVTPTPASQAATLWSRVARAASSVNMPVWMTETEGNDNTWTGGMELANWIFAALKYGHVSVWMHFYMSVVSGNSSGYVNGGVTNRRFDAAWHFYRFIRPGAVMVDCISSDTSVMTLAFTHAGKRTFAVLAINFGGTPATVGLAGSNLPSVFTLYRSSESERRVTVGSTGPTGISLPGNSMVTLVAEGYDVSGVSLGDRAALRARVRASGSMPVSTAYLLDGRMVRGSGMACGKGALIAEAAGQGMARIRVTPK